MKDANNSRSRLRIAYNIAIWLVLLLVIVAVFSPLRNIVLNRFLAATPTPLPALIPGDDLFYIQATPHGSIYIDGQLLSQLPVEHQTPPLQLSRGQHLITWKADPFKPLSCVVDVPSQAANEACPYETPEPLNANTNVRLITFSASLADLPAAQQTALKQSIQAALDRLQFSGTVQPGEQYLRGPLVGVASTVPALQPLLATMHLHLDTDPTSNRSCLDYSGDECTLNGQNCIQLCTNSLSDLTSPSGSQPSQPPARTSWDIVALFYPTWTYTTASGQLVAQDQPDATGAYIGTDHSVLLHVIWDSKGWHATIDAHSSFPSGADCVSMHSVVLAGFYGMLQGNIFTNLDWHLYAGTNNAASCLGVAFPSPPSSQHRPAYFLYRFGVLVAVNDLAHSYLPSLPVADAYEQSLAQSLIAQYKV